MSEYRANTTENESKITARPRGRLRCRPRGWLAPPGAFAGSPNPRGGATPPPAGAGWTNSPSIEQQAAGPASPLGCGPARPKKARPAGRPRASPASPYSGGRGPPPGRPFLCVPSSPKGWAGRPRSKVAPEVDHGQHVCNIAAFDLGRPEHASRASPAARRWCSLCEGSNLSGLRPIAAQAAQHFAARHRDDGNGQWDPKPIARY